MGLGKVLEYLLAIFFQLSITCLVTIISFHSRKIKFPTSNNFLWSISKELIVLRFCKYKDLNSIRKARIIPICVFITPAPLMHNLQTKRKRNKLSIVLISIINNYYNNSLLKCLENLCIYSTIVNPAMSL